MLFIPLGIFIYYTLYIDVSLLYVIQNLLCPEIVDIDA